jgi:hypothetical protein
MIDDKIVSICSACAKDFRGVRVLYPGTRFDPTLRGAGVLGVHNEALPFLAQSHHLALISNEPPWD